MKQYEDDKQDRIVIYNEIIDVLKIILLIFHIKHEKKMNLKGQLKLKELSKPSIKPEMKLQDAIAKF